MKTPNQIHHELADKFITAAKAVSVARYHLVLAGVATVGMTPATAATLAKVEKSLRVKAVKLRGRVGRKEYE